MSATPSSFNPNSIAVKMGGSLPLIGAVLLFLPNTAFAFPNRAPELQIIDMQSRAVERTIVAFPEYMGGIDTAVGDFDGNGTMDIVVVQSGGPQAAGFIRTFSSDGTLIESSRLNSKVPDGTELDVAVGEVDGDANDEIIISSPSDSRSVITILDGSLEPDRKTGEEFIAFPEFASGASVTVGNVVGDEKEEIIVGSGTGSFPLVRIFDDEGTMIAPDLSPFSENDTFGLNPAAINTGGGEYDDISIGYRNGGKTWVKTYRIDSERTYPVLSEFRAWSREFNSGVELDGVDLTGDGTEEIAVSPSGDKRAEVKFYRGDGELISEPSVYLYEEDFRGGAGVQFANIDRDKAVELIAVPRQQKQRGDINRGAKYIEVNLSEQTEYIWEDGYLRQVYLVSTGTAATPTPTGDFSISVKIPNHLYSGPGYYLPNTPWNLRFFNGGAGGNMYIHTAYWHNNFGHRMSHGCINMRQAEAKFVYDWADIGTPVWIHY